LEKFGLLHWVIAFVKDEGINLVAMVVVLHSIIDCELLKIHRVNEGKCFKACDV
jgi:hypothetical protein